MKVEVLCPGCQGGYLLEIEALSSGVPCPGCGESLDSSKANATAIDLPEPDLAAATAALPAATIAPAPAPASAEAATTTAPAESASIAVAEPPANEVAEAPREIIAPTEVVCPRCNLHFKPRGGAARAGSPARQTILIVEDMDYFREIAADALRGEYEVHGVATKDEARAFLGRNKADLMVLDLTLDGGEAGLDLLRELPTKPCPILIYTAQDESEMYGDSWDELKDLGADDIVIKGMNVADQLVRKVGSLLGRQWDEDD